MLYSEFSEVRPSVRRWLELNNYECENEHKLPNRQKIDVLATHKRTGNKLIVEIKAGRNNSVKYSLKRHMSQLLNYKNQYGDPNAGLVLAMPPNLVHQRTIEVCQRNAITLLVVPLSQNLGEMDRERLIQSAKNGQKVVYVVGRWMKLDEAIEILTAIKSEITR